MKIEIARFKELEELITGKLVNEDEFTQKVERWTLAVDLKQQEKPCTHLEQ